MTLFTRPNGTPGSPPYEAYVCLGRKNGLEPCSQSAVERELIDAAVFDYFTRVALDVAATREAIAKGQDVKLAEIDALRDQASRDLAKGERRLAKVTHGWQDDVISDQEYREQADELTANIAAGQAYLGQVGSRREALATDAAEHEFEEELIEQLTAIRDLIAGDAREGAQKGADASERRSSDCSTTSRSPRGI